MSDGWGSDGENKPEPKVEEPKTEEKPFDLQEDLKETPKIQTDVQQTPKDSMLSLVNEEAAD